MLREVYAAAKTTLSSPVSSFDETSTFTDFFNLIANVLIGIGIGLTVIFLVLGGIQYMTSRGDAKAAESARTALTNAVIGFVIVIFSVTLRFVIGNILGLDETAVVDPEAMIINYYL